MGQRGPKPRPKLKLIGGDAGPAFAPGLPKCPPTLSKGANACWRRTVKELSAAGVLSVADGDMLAAYCECVADLESLTAQVAREGWITEVPALDRNGRPTGAVIRRANPAVKMRDAAINRVRQLGIEFGLTPASRSRAGVVAEPAASKPMNKVQEIAARIEAARARPMGG